MTDQPKIPKLPKAAEDFADTVLRYRPKPKSEPAKKRRRRAAKIQKGQGI
jgi:hypothetical protein